MKLRPSTSTISRLSIAVIATAGLALGVACSGGGSSGGAFGGGAFSRPSSAPVAKSADDAPSRLTEALAAANSQVRPNQAQAKGIDPCRLVTREESEAALGWKLGQGQQVNDVSGDNCEYEDVDGLRSVTVSVLKGSFARSTYDGVREIITQNRDEVSGLGDKAFYASGLRTLYVLKGDVLLSVQAVDVFVSSQQSLPGISSLAKTALSRL